MRFLIKALVMRPIAIRKLNALYTERFHIQEAINRARKHRRKVTDLYFSARQNTEKCRYWETWV